MAAVGGQPGQAGCSSPEFGVGAGADIAAGPCVAADPGSPAGPDDASISEAETEAEAAPPGSDADADRCAW